jgi:predicted ester cyclase
MSIADNKAIVIRHLKHVVEDGRVNLIDGYFDTQYQKPENFRAFVIWLHKICTKIKVTILDMVAEGDKVAVFVEFELTCSSKYIGEYTGEYPPLDQPHTWKAMEFYQIVDGKFQTMVGLYDPQGRHWPSRKAD